MVVRALQRQWKDAPRSDGEGWLATQAAPLTRARGAILLVLVVLAAYTVFAGLRVTNSAGGGTGDRLKQIVERLAGQSAVVVAPVTASVESAAAFGESKAADDPLAVAEQVLKSSGGHAHAVAVVKDGALLATTHFKDGVDWIGAAKDLGGAKGIATTDTHSAYIYVGAPMRVAGGAAELIAAVNVDEAFSLGGLRPLANETLMLVRADGRVLAARPPFPITLRGGGDHSSAIADDPYSLISLLGVNLARLANDAQKGEETVITGANGKPLRLTVEPMGFAGLSAVAAAPAALVPAPQGSSVAADTVSLLAPLAISIALTILVFRQTRKAEEAHAQRFASEQRFRNAVEAARCGIWEWRLTDDRVYLSDVTGVMFGWGGGGVAAGAEVIERIAPEHAERVRSALNAAAQHGAFDVTFKVPGPDGPSWIDARGQGFGPKSEGGYTAILGVALDVTQERIAQARAVAAEARLHDAIESVSEAFALWNRHGRLVMSNRNFAQFFNINPDDIPQGTGRNQVRRLADRGAVQTNTAVEGTSGIREEERRDGRWLQISERRTSDGGLVLTAADITMIKRQEEARRLNEEALREAVSRLEEKRVELIDLADKYEQEKIRAQQANAAKSEFLANMSHELRTPLNAVNGFSEMMAMEILGPLGDKRYKEYANDILSSGQHLLSVINDILDMAKIEAGKTSLNLERVQVPLVVEETVRLMRNRIEQAGLTLSLDLGEPPEIEADSRAVKQVLLNLLSNSVKFTPPGGQIRIACRSAADRVRISVMDTGIGIDKADLDRLARPFEQVESQQAKTTQGTGLGLALSKSLVEMHEGRFDMASEPGRGTTVSFTLPRLQRKSRARGELESLRTNATESENPAGANPEGETSAPALSLM